MASPIVFSTPSYQINLTILLSIITVCLAAMGVLTKIYGRKKEEEPGKHPSCSAHDERGKRNEASIKELRDKVDAMKDEVSRTSVKLDSDEKTIDELKQDSRKLADKMDLLLAQVLEFLD